MTTNQKIASAGIAGLVIGVFIAFLAYILLRPKPSTFLSLPFKTSPGPVNRDTAEKGLDAYHDPDVFEKLDEQWQGKVNGVVYDSSGFFKDYSKVFDGFVKSHKAYPNCVWRLGMYWNVVYVGKRRYPKLNVYLIPTMEDTAVGKIWDYYSIRDDENSPYKTNSAKKNLTDPDDGFIYDQGTLFP